VRPSLRRNRAKAEARVERRDAARVEVAFHAKQVDAPGRSPGRRWVAELVDATGFLTVPKCVAWLTDCRPVMPVVLDFLVVPFADDRRLGYGTRMVEELRKVWPDLTYTDPVTKEGERFYETLPEPGPTDPARSG
jgi:hypothetical protein